jgi:alkyldihydroxyacetonephosphate synthase
MGIIIEATFRVLPYPERETVHAIGFKDHLAGLEALRKIMQAELRPAVTRLYDEPESKSRIAGFPEYKDHPCIAMLTFNGMKELVEVEDRLSLKICKETGGIEGSPEPAYKWMEHRFESLSAKPIFEERLMDTVEISAPWMALPDIYEGMKEAALAVRRDVHFGAHWSHAYTDGACMYATFIIPAPDMEAAAREHALIWEGLMKACLQGGGSSSHHHGIGYFRAPWLKEELGVGHQVLQGLKDVLDANHILNPGKLGLK